MKVWAGRSSDFVKGQLLRPVILFRKIESLQKQREKKLALLASLPREIDRIEAEIREAQCELSEYEIRESFVNGAPGASAE